MNPFRFIGIASLIGAPALMLALQSASETIVAENGVAKLGKESLEIFACTADPDRLNCWDYNGKDQPRIAEYLKAYFLLNDQGITIWPGQKNRLLVLSHSGEHGPLSNINSLSLPGSRDYNYLGGQIGTQKVNLHWYPIAASPDAKLGNYEGSFRSTVAVAKRMEMRIGASLAIGRGKLTLVGWHQTKRNEQSQGGYSGPYPPNAVPKSWTFEFKCEDVPAGYEIGFLPELDDSDGQQYVDENGKPVKPEKKNSHFRGTSNPNYWPIVRNIFLYSGGGILTGQTNVDPKYVKWLSPYVGRTDKIEFRDVPLDPK